MPEKNLQGRQEQTRQMNAFLGDGRGGCGTTDQNTTPGRWWKNIISENRPVKVAPNPEMGMCPGKIGLETFKNTPYCPSGGRGEVIFNSKAESASKMAINTE